MSTSWNFSPASAHTNLPSSSTARGSQRRSLSSKMRCGFGQLHRWLWSALCRFCQPPQRSFVQAMWLLIKPNVGEVRGVSSDCFSNERCHTTVVGVRIDVKLNAFVHEFTSNRTKFNQLTSMTPDVERNGRRTHHAALSGWI